MLHSATIRLPRLSWLIVSRRESAGAKVRTRRKREGRDFSSNPATRSAWIARDDPERGSRRTRGTQKPGERVLDCIHLRKFYFSPGFPARLTRRSRKLPSPFRPKDSRSSGNLYSETSLRSLDRRNEYFKRAALK